MNNKIEQLKEYARIIKDTPYALKTYLQTYDNTQKKYVPLELFPDQIQLLKDYEQYNENITRKYRQAGVTTVTAAWISKRLQLAKPDAQLKIIPNMNHIFKLIKGDDVENKASYTNPDLPIATDLSELITTFIKTI